MCGIVGIICNEDVTSRVVEGLKRLEYRGYDSAGVAVINDGISKVRAEGKIINLDKALKADPISGNIGIGHTRWATHGTPSTKNAHPHSSEDVCVVHNGIIENFIELRKELEAQGVEFKSDTDTEVVPHLIEAELKAGKDYKDAVRNAVAKLEGAYALGIIFKDNPDLLIAVKEGSPLAVGYADGCNSIGSDSYALAPVAQRITFLEEGDIAFITRDSIEIENDGASVEREIKAMMESTITSGKGDYRHFMQKEIFEQPSVIGTCVKRYFHPVTSEISFPELPLAKDEIKSITIVACGTSYFAGLTAKYYIEKYANIKVDVDLASEFRYRSPVLQDGNLVILISQSGETADTLAALRYAKEKGQKTLAIVNVKESSMAREADAILQIYAGPEIGVASTKAFTTQLAVLQLLTLFIADIDNKDEYSNQLTRISTAFTEIFENEEQISDLGKELANAKNILYIGRGELYPIANEGALKIKELTYIHAEALAAGELKHGYIALVDENLPIICIAPSGELFEKSASNIREVATRGGKVILISDKAGIEALKDVTYKAIEIPSVEEFTAPFICTLPLQLLAYHTAVHMGTDVDQPRNLAKSVTVE